MSSEITSRVLLWAQNILFLQTNANKHFFGPKFFDIEAAVNKSKRKTKGHKQNEN